MTEEIPQPPKLPWVGNGLLVDTRIAAQSICSIAKQYGPEIVKFTIFGHDNYYVSSASILNELCDEKRFCKNVVGPVEQLRSAVGDGLFTAHNEEPGWKAAHNILTPALGPLGVRDMFDEMRDIASQMVLKWAREGPDRRINACDDFTRLTLDTIALCAMGTRLNSFYSERLHPFVTTMIEALSEAERRAHRIPFDQYIFPKRNRDFHKNIKELRSFAQTCVDYRRNHPTPTNDLLNALLNGKDSESGGSLPDSNIINNIITMLVAGHETTSGMLSFTWYRLLKNPHALDAARKEVDNVVGTGPVSYEHISKVPYLDAVLRESLRLNPPLPGYFVSPKPGTEEPVILGNGRFVAPPDAQFVVLLPNVGRDPEVFGEDADEFKPERMYGENFNNLAPGAFKAFGNGARGCIGQGFAWQEAILTLIIMLQHFDVSMADPTYELQVKETLTLKPDNFFMKVKLRRETSVTTLQHTLLNGISQPTRGRQDSQSNVSPNRAKRGPMSVLFGSNSGTCEILSQVLAARAESLGFSTNVAALDSVAKDFPSDRPVVIVSASYEGLPPNNAKQFVDWLESTDADLSGARFAVFGCGHRDWARTFQRIPQLIEDKLRERGASVLAPRGGTDVAAGVIFEEFDVWMRTLWNSFGESLETHDFKVLDISIDSVDQVQHFRDQLQEGLVLKSVLLSDGELRGSEKRHIDIKLPPNMSYTTGDYVAILPRNDPRQVERVLQRFGIPWNSTMMLQNSAHPAIPANTKLPVFSVLSTSLELNSPATSSNLTKLKSFINDETVDLPDTSEQSLIDILEDHPSIDIPFPVYVSMLNPIRLRQYSISSSPLDDPTVASITFSVAEQERRFGVATSYLRHLPLRTKLQLAIKEAHGLRLPDDPMTPIIMIGAGAGLAPFRAFVQERAIRIGKGDKFGRALLFVGCRSPEHDKLYDDELTAWEAMGAADRFYAFSRASELSKKCRYVQDRLWNERKAVAEVLRANSKIYVCGSSKIASAVVQMLAKIMAAEGDVDGARISEEAAADKLTKIRGDRLLVDVFD